MRIKHFYSTYKSFFYVILVLVLIYFFVVFMSNAMLMPQFTEVAYITTSNKVEEVITKCISESLTKKDLMNIIVIDRDSSHKITSIYADAYQINRISWILTESMLNEFTRMKREKVYVPSGSLTGIEYFSGKGPMVGMRIQPVGKIKTQLHTELSQAGINQTKYTVILEIQVQTSVAAPLLKNNFEISKKVLLAETVVVGEVPQFMPRP